LFAVASVKKKQKLYGDIGDIFDELIYLDGNGDQDGKIPSLILLK
jgi:hypothetical protein